MSGQTAGGVAAKTNPHIFLVEGEAPGAPGIAATRCRACGAVTLGNVPVCSACLARATDFVAAGQRGSLVEFSIAHHPADGFEAPYAIGLVRTSEGLMLFAPLSGHPEGLRNGMKLRFETVPRPGGKIGFAYAPAEVA